MSKTALITGITGQDGAYLSKLLLERGYRVIGLTRSYISSNFHGLDYLKIRDHVETEEGDLMDFSQVVKLLNQYKPDEIYNLSAQSSVSISFRQPIGTFQQNVMSVLNLLEALKLMGASTKLYQASSSEMYGMVNQLPISEASVLHPLSPYAISKASAHWWCIHNREAYNQFVCCGILFNHESYLRSPNFFVKKVLKESIGISRGKQKELRVGNIDIKRDFGYAPRYVEAMYLMMQQPQSGDYLICSGQSLSLRNIIEHIFNRLSIPPDRLVVDPQLYRPTDIEDIYGTNQKAKSQLNWAYELTFYDVLDLLLEEEQRNWVD